MDSGGVTSQTTGSKASRFAFLRSFSPKGSQALLGQPGGVVGNDGQIGHVQGIGRHNRASQRTQRAQPMIGYPAHPAPTNGRARVIALAPSDHGAVGVPGVGAVPLERRNLTMLIEEINDPQKGDPRVKTINEVNEEIKTAPNTNDNYCKKR